MTSRILHTARCPGQLWVGTHTTALTCRGTNPAAPAALNSCEDEPCTLPIAANSGSRRAAVVQARDNTGVTPGGRNPHRSGAHVHVGEQSWQAQRVRNRGTCARAGDAPPVVYTALRRVPTSVLEAHRSTPKRPRCFKMIILFFPAIFRLNTVPGKLPLLCGTHARRASHNTKQQAAAAAVHNVRLRWSP